MSFIDRILRRDVSTSKRGAEAEAIAARYLSRHGLRILTQNYRVRGGEIDLVCRDGAMLVFVEVRLRTNTAYGGAAASITFSKQQRLILAARHWLSQHGDQTCRFDCILLDELDEARVEWIKNAFSAD
jgi:putative endonuclease